MTVSNPITAATGLQPRRARSKAEPRGENPANCLGKDEFRLHLVSLGQQLGQATTVDDCLSVARSALEVKRPDVFARALQAACEKVKVSSNPLREQMFLRDTMAEWLAKPDLGASRGVVEDAMVETLIGLEQSTGRLLPPENAGKMADYLPQPKAHRLFQAVLNMPDRGLTVEEALAVADTARSAGYPDLAATLTAQVVAMQAQRQGEGN